MNNGFGDLIAKLNKLDDINEIMDDAINTKDNPALAMVDSDNGITNLHVPSDVIIEV